MKLKKIGALLLSSLFAVGSVPVSAEDSVSTTMVVNEASVIKPSDRRMLGINDTWSHTSRNKLVVIPNSTEINPAYVEAFKETGAKVAFSRMAGGESQMFCWKDSIGEFEERGNYGDYTNGDVVNFGIVEWINSTKQIDKNAKFDFCVNMLKDTSDNAADLVRFLCLDPSDPKAIGSDGTNWAQRRVDLGIAEPVVPVFELGNELDGSYVSGEQEKVKSQADWYIGLCKEYMAKMRAVKPDLEFAALMYTMPHETPNYSRIWNQKVISELGPECDYVSFHYYYHGGSNQALPLYRMPEITDYIDALPEGQRPRILFTEHAKWTQDGWSVESTEAVSNFTGTLVTGQVINQTTNDKYTAGMNYHCMRSGVEGIDAPTIWHVISQYVEDGKFYISGIGELFRLYDYAYGSGKDGENVVKTTLSGNSYLSTTSSAKLTATAHTTPEGGLNLVLVNNEQSTVGHNITFSANNDYKLEREYILKGADLTSDNDPVTPEALYTKCNIINSTTKFTSYYVPPKSAIVLKLVPMNKQLGQTKAMELTLDYASEESDGSLYIKSDDRILEFDGQLFTNKSAIDAKNLSLTILKPGYTLSNISSDEHLKDAVAYVSIKDVFKDRAYFKVVMPEDAQEGVYTAILTAYVDDIEYMDSLEFRYIPELRSKYVRSVSVGGEYVDGMVEVSNEDYSLDCVVSMNTLFPSGKDYQITITSVDTGELAYLGNATHGEKAIDTVKIKMPKDAIAGTYEIAVKCGNDVAEAKTRFSFKKPTEKLILSDIIKTGGQKLTLDNIKAASSFDILATNVTDAAVDAIIVAAAYDANGVMIASASASPEDGFEPGAQTPVNVPMAISGSINTVKVYVWDKTSAVPYTEVYSIK